MRRNTYRSYTIAFSEREFKEFEAIAKYLHMLKSDIIRQWIKDTYKTVQKAQGKDNDQR